MSKRKLKVNIKILILVLILIICFCLVLEADNRMRLLISSYSQNKARILSNSVINETVHKYIKESNIQYTNLLKINSTSEGKVTSVEFDTIRIAEIKSGIVAEIQNKINNNDSITLSVPVGTLTGSQFLSNRGPSIKMRLQISPVVYSKIKSEFISAGINQTLHRITLDIKTNIYFIMPWYRTTGDFETEFIIAETVIVGDVPDAYTNVIEYPGSDMAGCLFDYSAEKN